MNTVKHLIYTGIGTLLTAQSAFGIDPYGSATIKSDLKWVGDNKPIETIQNFIIGLLGFLGLIMVLMAIWGGWKVLTSGAEDEGKEAGKKIIINAVIGIVIIFFAWTITSLVFGILTGGGKLAN